jgi:hypothetical protein
VQEHGNIILAIKFQQEVMKGNSEGNKRNRDDEEMENFQEKADKTNANEKDKNRGYADKHNMASFVCRRKEQIKHKRNHKNKF